MSKLILFNKDLMKIIKSFCKLKKNYKDSIKQKKQNIYNNIKKFYKKLFKSNCSNEVFQKSFNVYTKIWCEFNYINIFDLNHLTIPQLNSWSKFCKTQMNYISSSYIFK